MWTRYHRVKGICPERLRGICARWHAIATYGEPFRFSGACILESSMTFHAQATAARQRRNELTAQLKSLREDLRTMTASEMGRVQMKDTVLEITPDTCTGRFRDTAIVLCIRKNDEGVTARRYLETTLGRKWGAATTAAGYMTRIRELAEQVRGDLTVPTAWWVRRIADAETYVNEQDLHDWVHTQNEASGVAPTTRAVVTRRSASQRRSDPAEGTTSATVLTSLSRRQVQWTRRFMRRWDVRRGTLPVGTCMPMKEAEEKVRREARRVFFSHLVVPKIRPRAHFPDPDRRPKNGRTSAATKGPHDSKRVRNPAAEKGPPKRTPKPPSF